MGIGFTTRALLRIPFRNDDDNPEFPSNMDRKIEPHSVLLLLRVC